MFLLKGKVVLYICDQVLFIVSEEKESRPLVTSPLDFHSMSIIILYTKLIEPHLLLHIL